MQVWNVSVLIFIWHYYTMLLHFFIRISWLIYTCKFNITQVWNSLIFLVNNVAYAIKLCQSVKLYFYFSDKSHNTLRRRAYMKKEDFSFYLSEEEKDLILRNTEELREHVLMLSPDLTSICEQYLYLIHCTVDWQKNL